MACNVPVQTCAQDMCRRQASFCFHIKHSLTYEYSSLTSFLQAGHRRSCLSRALLVQIVASYAIKFHSSNFSPAFENKGGILRQRTAFCYWFLLLEDDNTLLLEEVEQSQSRLWHPAGVQDLVHNAYRTSKACEDNCLLLCAH